jgi:hypothetical protein
MEVRTSTIRQIRNASIGRIIIGFTACAELVEFLRGMIDFASRAR